MTDDLRPDLQMLVGMPLEAAQNAALRLGVRTVRVLSYNGQGLVGAADQRTDRVNVTVEQDLVAQVHGIG